MLIVMAVAAVLLDPGKPSLRDALVRTDGDRRRGHVRELQPGHRGDVRAGGDCGQPRLLHSEPALAGPNAGSRAAGASALITDGGPVVTPATKQGAMSRSQRLFDLGR